MAALKSIVSPLALAAILALGAAPAFSASWSSPPDISQLTPAERTKLADQCRIEQSEEHQRQQSRSNDPSDQTEGPFNVNPAYCASIGITG